MQHLTEDGTYPLRTTHNLWTNTLQALKRKIGNAFSQKGTKLKILGTKLKIWGTKLKIWRTENLKIKIEGFKNLIKLTQFFTLLTIFSSSNSHWNFSSLPQPKNLLQHFSINLGIIEVEIFIKIDDKWEKFSYKIQKFFSAFSSSILKIIFHIFLHSSQRKIFFNSFLLF